MEKPKVILELEEELNCEFKLLELSEIEEYDSNSSKYSFDETGNITGIAIRYMGLKNIPNAINLNIKN